MPTETLTTQEVQEELFLCYRTVPWVGSGVFRLDLGVIDPSDPGRFILGVVCDGENYLTADTARDRDRLRIQVLENLGWRIHRVWSPDWVQRRETEAKRLAKALKDAEKGSLQKARKEAKKYPAKPMRNSVEKVKVVGNAAGTGARMTLISRKARKIAKEISKKTEYIELAAEPSFQSEFFNSQYIPYADLSKYPETSKLLTKLGKYPKKPIRIF